MKLKSIIPALTFIFLILCNLQSQNSANNSIASWWVKLYGENTDLPKSSVYLPQEKSIIVLGQKIGKNPAGSYDRALVKLSATGKVIKERFFSYYNDIDEIAINSKKQIFVAGIKGNRLLLQEITSGLETIFDTVLNVKVSDMSSVKLLFDGDDFIFSLNRDGSTNTVVKFDKNFQELWRTETVNDFSKCNNENLLYLKDAIITSDRKIVSVGYGQCNGSPNAPSRVVITQVDANTGELEWNTNFGDGKEYFWGDRIVQFDGKFYVLGSGPGKVVECNGCEDIFVFCFDNKGQLLWKKQYGGERSDTPGGIIAYNNQLYIVGHTSSSKGDFVTKEIGINLLFFSIDKSGNITKKRVYDQTFGYSKNIMKMGDKFLILGYHDFERGYSGRRWDLILTTPNFN